YKINEVAATSRGLTEGVDSARARIYSVGNCGLHSKPYFIPDGWQAPVEPLRGCGQLQPHHYPDGGVA
ncbi:hypothetical protein BGZ59_003459, partial [Podila verticillata]